MRNTLTVLEFEGSVEYLINKASEAHKKGATNYQMTAEGFVLYREMTQKEYLLMRKNIILKDLEESEKEISSIEE